MASTQIKNIAWLAGVMEGEASFYTYIRVNKNRSTTSYPEFTFQSNDCDITERVAAMIKSNVSLVKPYGIAKNDAYKVRACSTKSIQWMMTIYVLMGKRRQAKIREAIAEWKTSVRRRQLVDTSPTRLRQKGWREWKRMMSEQPKSDKPFISPFEKKDE